MSVIAFWSSQAWRVTPVTAWCLDAGLPDGHVGNGDPGSREGDARASDEFRAVLVQELGHWARGAAGDLLEGAGRVVVLAGEDRPLARDQQLRLPGRYPRAGEALEELRFVGVANERGDLIAARK